ncbi:sulfotransferase [Azospirillum cavernae]|uniref:Sulfotransferase n=1 Tax=Azospirillum cavernae TaxID=2320860 RepID=A0A418VKT9_9PROT|nr:sulfotransferase [Azospirillum cavernae]RJF76731.1 sulfotransferase [Azospirillum cavernae]
MKFHMHTEVTSIVENSIFITGGSRSGTTMMSRLVNSLSNVENFFEHPFVYLHFYLIDKIEESAWRFQLEGFLVEELMLQAMCGRILNFNSHDDSWVFHGRPREEIEARMARTWRRQEAFPLMLDRRLAFKMPEMLPQLDRLKMYYPNMTSLVMLRRPESVISSVMKKGWYSDDQMQGINGEFIFKTGYSKRIPPWVPDGMEEKYIAMPEVERAAFCYILQYENLISRKDCVVVDYDKMMLDPYNYFSAVCERIGCSFGSLTNEIIQSIREPSKDRSVEVNMITPEYRQKISDVYETCRALAIR